MFFPLGNPPHEIKPFRPVAAKMGSGNLIPVFEKQLFFSTIFPFNQLLRAEEEEEEEQDGETEEKDHRGTWREAICVNGMHIKLQIRIRGPMKALA